MFLGILSRLKFIKIITNNITYLKLFILFLYSKYILLLSGFTNLNRQLKVNFRNEKVRETDKLSLHFKTFFKIPERESKLKTFYIN